MCEIALEKLRSRHKELSREIEILQTMPAGHSDEMKLYKSECQNIKRQIVALEQSQASKPTVMSNIHLNQPKLRQPTSV